MTRAQLTDKLAVAEATQPVPDFVGTLGPGAPLDAHTRQRMETAFGADFSDVEVHTGAEAGEVARRHAAQALTIGDHIAFAPGNYRPGTPVGDAMLAHELAHTLQQGGPRAQQVASETETEAAPAPPLEPVGSALEADADLAAVGAMTRLSHGAARAAGASGLPAARPALGSALRVQRCSCGGTAPPPRWDGTFEALSFTPNINGGLIADDRDPEVAVLFPFFYTVAADVMAHGGTDEQAKHWQAGYTQTARDVDFTANYALPGPSRKHHQRMLTKVSESAWDGGDTKTKGKKDKPPPDPPWYASPETFTHTEQVVSPLMDDWPSMPVPWVSKDGKATLYSTTGVTRFATWLIVKQRESWDTMVFLKWDTWEVDWSAEFDGDHKKKMKEGPGGRKTGEGDGPGNVKPVLKGTTANELVNHPDNTKWDPP